MQAEVLTVEGYVSDGKATSGEHELQQSRELSRVLF